VLKLNKKRIQKKDIQYIKPFLSVIAVSKCILLVSGTFFGKKNPLIVVISSFCTWTTLFIISFIWAIQSSDSPRDQFGMGEPCWPPFINIWRSLTFAGGSLGAIYALLAYIKFFSAATATVLVGLTLGILFIMGLIWYKIWIYRVAKSIGHSKKKL